MKGGAFTTERPSIKESPVNLQLESSKLDRQSRNRTQVDMINICSNKRASYDYAMIQVICMIHVTEAV